MQRFRKPTSFWIAKLSGIKDGINQIHIRLKCCVECSVTCFCQRELAWNDRKSAKSAKKRVKCRKLKEKAWISPNLFFRQSFMPSTRQTFLSRNTKRAERVCQTQSVLWVFDSENENENADDEKNPTRIHLISPW